MTKSDKRKEILKASLKLFAEQGFHGTPTSMIAQQAGVASGMIFYYFESKEALIAELFRELEERITLVIMESYSPEEPIRVRFHCFCKALFQYFITYPRDFKYLELFLNSPYGVAFRRSRILGKTDGRDVFRELFEDGISQQLMKDIPLTMLYALAFGPLLAVARDHILGFIQLDEHLIEITVNTCWDTVKR